MLEAGLAVAKPRHQWRPERVRVERKRGASRTGLIGGRRFGLGKRFGGDTSVVERVLVLGTISFGRVFEVRQEALVVVSSGE
jgi:hypothetical protein